MEFTHQVNRQFAEQARVLSLKIITACIDDIKVFVTRRSRSWNQASRWHPLSIEQATSNAIQSFCWLYELRESELSLRSILENNNLDYDYFIEQFEQRFHGKSWRQFCYLRRISKAFIQYREVCVLQEEGQFMEAA